jgi:hypothetical protein
MISKVDTVKKIVVIKGSVTSNTRTIITRLENIGYTAIVIVSK